MRNGTGAWHRHRRYISRSMRLGCRIWLARGRSSSGSCGLRLAQRLGLEVSISWLWLGLEISIPGVWLGLAQTLGLESWLGLERRRLGLAQTLGLESSRLGLARARLGLEGCGLARCRLESWRLARRRLESWWLPWRIPGWSPPLKRIELADRKNSVRHFLRFVDFNLLTAVGRYPPIFEQ